MKFVTIFIILVGIYTSLYLMSRTEGFTPSPPMANFGTNIWRSPFDNSLHEFDKRYKIKEIQGILKYPNHYTVTGEFIDDGPLEWNHPLEIQNQ